MQHASLFTPISRTFKCPDVPAELSNTKPFLASTRSPLSSPLPRTLRHPITDPYRTSHASIIHPTACTSSVGRSSALSQNLRQLPPIPKCQAIPLPRLPFSLQSAWLMARQRHRRFRWLGAVVIVRTWRNSTTPFLQIISTLQSTAQLEVGSLAYLSRLHREKISGTSEQWNETEIVRWGQAVPRR